MSTGSELVFPICTLQRVWVESFEMYTIFYTSLPWSPRKESAGTQAKRGSLRFMGRYLSGLIRRPGV